MKICLFVFNIKCLICYLEDFFFVDIGLILFGLEFVILLLVKFIIINNRLYIIYSINKKLEF